MRALGAAVLAASAWACERGRPVAEGPFALGAAPVTLRPGAALRAADGRMELCVVIAPAPTGPGAVGSPVLPHRVRPPEVVLVTGSGGRENYATHLRSQSGSERGVPTLRFCTSEPTPEVGREYVAVELRIPTDTTFTVRRVTWWSGRRMAPL